MPALVLHKKDSCLYKTRNETVIPLQHFNQTKTNVTDFACCFNRVIIIDDSNVDRQIARFFVHHTNLGSEIIEFDNPVKAIGFLEEHVTELKESTTLILLDLRMPGMNGFDFLCKECDLLTRLQRNLVIVMVSAELDFTPFENDHATRLISRFISKPLNKTKVQEIRSNLNPYIKMQFRPGQFLPHYGRHKPYGPVNTF